jgi:hypothetical protein
MNDETPNLPRQETLVRDFPPIGSQVTGTWGDAAGQVFRVESHWPHPGKTSRHKYVTLINEQTGEHKPATVNTLRPVS